MACLVIFCLMFLVSGVYMIVTKKGVRVLSRKTVDVTGGEAIINGIVAILIGLVLAAFILHDLLPK